MRPYPDNSPYLIQMRTADKRIIAAALSASGGSLARAAADLGKRPFFVRMRAYTYGIGPYADAATAIPPVHGSSQPACYLFKDDGSEYARRMCEAESHILEFALRGAGGEIPRAAAALGIRPLLFYSKASKYQIGSYRDRSEQPRSYNRKPLRNRRSVPTTATPAPPASPAPEEPTS